MLRVRLDPELDAALDRLKIKGHVNISAWVRSTLRAELKRRTPGRPVAAARRPPVPRAPAAPKPPPTIPEWRPWSLPDGNWGARYTGDVRTLPADLVGRLIRITTKGGEKWTATVLEVVPHEGRFVLVRDSGKPTADGSHSQRER